MGQFILTGSAVPPDTKEITHSGTGRFTWLTMRPTSLFESGESTGEVSLEDLFEGKINLDGESQLGIEDLACLVCRGGCPEIARHGQGLRPPETSPSKGQPQEPAPA